jgi:hypothetical protein
VVPIDELFGCFAERWCQCCVDNRFTAPTPTARPTLTKRAQEHVAKFITKLGTSMPEVNVSKLEADFPLAFDADKTVRPAYQKVRESVCVGGWVGVGVGCRRERGSHGSLLKPCLLLSRA